MRVLVLSLWLASVALAQSLQDGPHVFWEGRRARIVRVDARGRTEETRAKAPFSLDLPGLAAAPLRLGGSLPAPAPDRLADPGTILAVSDAHGQFDSLRRLLQAQGVMDGALRWRFGRGHLVVVGDVFDRGPQVTEILWFLRALAEEARKAGGAVHQLLGNHEAMILTGDTRYAHPRYGAARGGLAAHGAHYGPDTELGRWLRSRPTLLQIGSFLFVHGGPSPAFLARGFTLERANRAVRKALGAGGRASEEAAFLLGREGPLWYRGLLPEAPGDSASDSQVEAVAAAFGVRAMVVGHTTQPSLGSHRGGRVFAIDAGLKDGRPGEAWIWDQGRVWRGHADGRREPLEP